MGGSAEWADRRSDCCRRGMTAPVLAVGDGARRFWAALRQVLPGTREQRCCWHKQANVSAALAKSAHPSASTTLRDVCNAEDIDTAQAAVKTFELDYAAKYRNAVAKITDDLDALREFYKCPAERWIHLRIANPIESTFATVGLRTKGWLAPRLGWPSPTSSSTPPRPGSDPSTRQTWSPSFAPAPSSTKTNCSNDSPTSRPPDRGNQPKTEFA